MSSRAKQRMRELTCGPAASRPPASRQEAPAQPSNTALGHHCAKPTAADRSLEATVRSAAREARVRTYRHRALAAILCTGQHVHASTRVWCACTTTATSTPQQHVQPEQPVRRATPASRRWWSAIIRKARSCRCAGERDGWWSRRRSRLATSEPSSQCDR